MRLIFLYLLSFSFLTLSAQDTLIMLNGKIYNADVIYIKNDVLKYEQKKKKKTIQKEIDKNRVYAIHYPDGKQELVYHQDSAIGFVYTPEDMMKFIYGERDAFTYYNGFAKHFAINFAISSVAGYMIGSILALPVPFITSAAGLLFPNKIPGNVRYIKYVKEEPYQKGYNRVVRSKKIQHLLLGGALGVATGLVLRNAF